MGTARKFFIFVAELAMACMVIGLVFLVYRQGEDSSKSSMSKLSTISAESVNYEYKQWDGEILSGTEVKSLYARYHLKQLTFEIATKETLSTSSPYFSEIVEGLEVSDPRYINEEGEFFVETIEQSGEILGFKITQR